MTSHTITVAELRGLREFAGEDKEIACRYGVALLDDGRAAATDGSSGALLGVDPVGPEDPMHRPLILTAWSPSSAPLVPLPAIDSLLKGAPTKSRIRWQRTADGGALVERLGSTGAVEVAIPIPASLTVFPPLWRVCGYDGRDKPTGEIAVSSVLLARLAVIERALPKHKHHAWSLRLGGSLDAIVATPEARYEGRPWVVAIMPIRLCADELEEECETLREQLAEAMSPDDVGALLVDAGCHEPANGWTRAHVVELLQELAWRAGEIGRARRTG